MVVFFFFWRQTGEIVSLFGFSTAPATLPAPTSLPSVKFDFNGDNIADVARWKASTGEWKFKDNACNQQNVQSLGSSVSLISPGDFDGDGRTDVAVFTSGTWTIKPCSGASQFSVSWGTAGDIPVVGDYNGDGRADYAIFRSSTNTWWVLHSNDFSNTSTVLGAAGDLTVPGDYDGDGKSDFGVFRPSTGDWHIKNSSSGAVPPFHWGVASDIPVPADYDGDSKTDYGVYRPSSGTWFVYKSSGGGSYLQQIWGNYGDQPVPADYDGDGKAEMAIWRPKTGVWFTLKSCSYDNSCGANPPYLYESLGMNGDVPVEAAYIKKIGGAVQNYEFAKKRLSPKNATGGTDLYSRNFFWGTGLVGLPGRAGLDAGFGISYNSLVWLKDTENNVMVFDPDQSNITPGFRFGFPTIEPVYYDKNNGRFSYLMVTPSGGRVEFQQIGASDTYETADSSYVQLKTQSPSGPNDPVNTITIKITGTDGTQMSYEWLAGAFRCKEIKDRNGNFITISHDQYGLLRTVTDTLGRIITVNYDNELYPTSITQDWKTNNGEGAPTTHTHAAFAYTNKTINTSFASSLGVFGPPNGATIRVLQKITAADGSFTTFEYNGYGQIWKVNNYAADWHKLNQLSINIDNPSANQTDCPRFSQTRSWVENFNLNAGGNAQEVVLNNTITENQTIPEAGGTGTRIEVSMAGHPNNAVSRIFVGSSGWMDGLPIVNEDWADNGNGLARQRWTENTWTQDDPSLPYINNPRVTENKVGDNARVRRTRTEYRLLPNTTVAEYGLVDNVQIIDPERLSILKKVETDYNLSSTYVSRRIIGLPSETRVYGVENDELTLVSRVTYGFDEEGFTVEPNQNITPIHHDTAFGTSFIIGRGNLTSTTRHDVTGQTSPVTSKIRYDIAGSPVAQIDPMDRKVRVGYADVFNDGINRNSYAYPTTLTDTAGTSLGDSAHSSTVKYRFDIGANVWAKSPTVDGNAANSGKETTREFDAQGRLLKQTLVNTGAYTRYEYPYNGIQTKAFATIVDTNNNNTGDAADEVLTEGWTDGAGRILKSRTEHPGSAGGYSGSLVEYDILGRVKRATVPTEIDSGWNITGDDLVRGWLWTSQEYDWKGRVIREVNTDGTDKLISYEGCGCAGGQVTTIQGELVPRTDGTSGNARRTQKVHDDILGRTYKTEAMNWDGSVYSTAVRTFNGRDQVTQSRQYAGSTSSSTYQDATANFDGHGRLKTQHLPEQQNPDGTPTFTTYNYNPDDSISSVVDGRGAVANYVYGDPRGLLTQINFVSPNATQVPVAPSVNVSYDNLGNRTQMTDGLGSVAYEYDSLSRMTAETRQFSDSLTDPSVPSGGFRLEYVYGLGGQLKSYKDPYGRQFDFGFDRAGRTASVGGTAYAGVTNYASNIKYRAFGSVKQIDYGNQTTAAMTYNNRLQPYSYRLMDGTQTLFGKDYFYTTGNGNDNDGLIKRSVHYDDTQSVNDRAKGNQVNTYDSQGRIKSSETGEEGLTPFGNYRNGPYQQIYSYNVFGKLTGKNDRDFGNNIVGCTGCPRGIVSTETVVNNRTQSSYYSTTNFQQTITDYQYDADGRTLLRNGITAKYDSSGEFVLLDDTGTNADNAYAYDGNGALAKWVQTWSPASNDAPFNYYLRSSVFGSDVLELDRNGAMAKEYVYSANGSKLAYLKNNEVIWINSEPSGKETYEIKQDRTAKLKQTYDPTGVPATNNGYNGGGPCPVIYCNSQANSNVVAIMQMGYRGMEILMARRNAERWQDSVFWNLGLYMRDGIIVDSHPPAGWDPYEDNLNRISDPHVLTPPWSGWSKGGFVENPAQRGLSFSPGDGTISVAFKDNRNARSALEKVVKGDCAKALMNLFANLKGGTNPSNPVRNTDILQLFDELAAQKEGGFFFNATNPEANAKFLELNPGGQLVGGGGGVTFSSHIGRYHGTLPMASDKGAYMYIYVFQRAASTFDFKNNRPASLGLINSNIALARRALVSILIHEMAHAAGKNNTFSHPQMDAAAKALDAEIAKGSWSDNNGGSAPYFDAYVLKHCGVGFEGQE